MGLLRHRIPDAQLPVGAVLFALRAIRGGWRTAGVVRVLLAPARHSAGDDRRHTADDERLLAGVRDPVPGLAAAVSSVRPAAACGVHAQRGAFDLYVGHV